MNTDPAVHVVLVNHNGWRDTVECLDSLQRLDWGNYTMVVVDNDSADGSLERIREWARGGAAPPPAGKPVICVEYDAASARAGGSPPREEAHRSVPSSRRLVIIRAGGNLGFAGGNNLGIAYAMAHREVAYVWFLNNDTVAAPGALAAMVRRLEEDPRAGICGSTLLYHHRPEVVQALGGGRYNSWFGLTRHIGAGERADQAVDARRVESRADYIVGASMLVTRAFLAEVGPMCEEYFLYYEDLDWAARAMGRFTLVWAPLSIVRHKVGGATDGREEGGKKSPLADYWGLRNRLLFARKHHPATLPLIYLSLGVSFLRRLARGRLDRAAMVLGIIFGRDAGGGGPVCGVGA